MTDVSPQTLVMVCSSSTTTYAFNLDAASGTPD